MMYMAPLRLRRGLFRDRRDDELDRADEININPEREGVVNKDGEDKRPSLPADEQSQADDQPKAELNK